VSKPVAESRKASPGDFSAESAVAETLREERLGERATGGELGEEPDRPVQPTRRIMAATVELVTRPTVFGTAGPPSRMAIPPGS
jgi:hypothetical protein